MSELAVRGEHEQSGGLRVEGRDVDPAAVLWSREIELVDPLFTRAAARGLVKGKEARRMRCGRQANVAAVDCDALLAAQRVAGFGRSAVDRDAAFRNPTLDLPARA